MNLVIGLILVLSLTAVFLFFRSTEILSVAKKRISDSFEEEIIILMHYLVLFS